MDPIGEPRRDEPEGPPPINAEQCAATPPTQRRRTSECNAEAAAARLEAEDGFCHTADPKCRAQKGGLDPHAAKGASTGQTTTKDNERLLR